MIEITNTSCCNLNFRSFVGKYSGTSPVTAGDLFGSFIVALGFGAAWNPLSSKRSPGEAPVGCQKTWRMHTNRPPHVGAMAWASATPTIRQHHTRCLWKLSMVPVGLLRQISLSTAIECVKRDAVSPGGGPKRPTKNNRRRQANFKIFYFTRRKKEAIFAAKEGGGRQLLKR